MHTPDRGDLVKIREALRNMGIDLQRTRKVVIEIEAHTPVIKIHLHTTEFGDGSVVNLLNALTSSANPRQLSTHAHIPRRRPPWACSTTAHLP
jgi:hypothetical protein